MSRPSGAPPARLTPPPRPSETPLVPPRRRGGRRGPSPTAGILVAFLVLVTLFVVLVLPRWAERRAAVTAVSQEAELPATPAEPEPEALAAAEDSPPLADEEDTESPPLPESADPVPLEIDERLAEASQALSRNDGYAAAVAYRRVLELAPGHPGATQGLRRAEGLDRLRGLLAEAAEAEQRGRSEDARRAWQEALALDPSVAEARQGLARLQESARASEFSAVMSEALAAYGRNDFDGARSALERAAAIGLSPERVAALRAQIAEREREIEIAEMARRAVELEAQEKWAEASELYGKLLEADGGLALAQSGARRSAARVELDRKLEGHLAGAERMTNDSVLEDARSTLVAAREVAERGPRLASQIERLEELLAVVSVPVPVVLESDETTEVAVYQVGRLGRFARHELQLRPGRYTVVGTRRGYRDVRLSLVVEPGQPTTLEVRCEDSI